LIGEGDRSSYKDYINNFIYVPASVALPTSVPSAWQALAASLARMVGG
jgi:hypothetical protein